MTTAVAITWGASFLFIAIAIDHVATGVVPIAVTSGGTGANTAAAARASLSAAVSGNNADITSLTGLTTPLSVVFGGTA
jgi:hypothetical protein